MTDAEQAKSKKTPVWVWILVGFLALTFLAGIFGGDDDSPTASEPESSETEAPASEEETEEPVEEEPTETPVPESFSTIEDLTAAITAEFGETTNMDLPRDFEISLAEDGWLNVAYVMDENLTAGLTRSSAWFDTEEIFLLARKADFVTSLTVTTRLPLVNNLGEELGPQDVFIVYFDEDVYSRINTDNLAGEMYSDAATSVFIHPALQ